MRSCSFFWTVGSARSNQPTKSDANVAKSSAGSAKQTRALHAKKEDSKRGLCAMCQKDHFIMFCEVYKAKSAPERKGHIETNGLCLNCLGRHKLSEYTSKKTCSVCNACHHTTLHEACLEVATAKASHVSRRSSGPKVAVLLATARGRVRPIRRVSRRPRLDRPGL